MTITLEAYLNEASRTLGEVRAKKEARKAEAAEVRRREITQEWETLIAQVTPLIPEALRDLWVKPDPAKKEQGTRTTYNATFKLDDDYVLLKITFANYTGEWVIEKNKCVGILQAPCLANYYSDDENQTVHYACQSKDSFNYFYFKDVQIAVAIAMERREKLGTIEVDAAAKNEEEIARKEKREAEAAERRAGKPENLSELAEYYLNKGASDRARTVALVSIAQNLEYFTRYGINVQT